MCCLGVEGCRECAERRAALYEKMGSSLDDSIAHRPRDGGILATCTDLEFTIDLDAGFTTWQLGELIEDEVTIF